MYFEDLIKRSYIKSEPPTDDEVVLLMAGCREQVDKHLVVSKADFDEILMNNRTKDPTSEAILMSIGRTGITLGDPIWDVMLQRESVVDRFAQLCNDEAVRTLSSLERKASVPPTPDFEIPPSKSEVGYQEVPAPTPTPVADVGAPAPFMPEESIPTGAEDEVVIGAEFGPQGFPEEGTASDGSTFSAESEDGAPQFGIPETEGGIPSFGIEPEADAPTSSNGSESTPESELGPVVQETVPEETAPQGVGNSGDDTFLAGDTMYGIPAGEDGMGVYMDNPALHQAYMAEPEVGGVVEDAPTPGSSSGSSVSETGTMAPEFGIPVEDPVPAESEFGVSAPEVVEEQPTPTFEVPSTDATSAPSDVPDFGVPPEQGVPAPEFGIPTGQEEDAPPEFGIPMGQEDAAAPVFGIPEGQEEEVSPVFGIPLGQDTPAESGVSVATETTSVPEELGAVETSIPTFGFPSPFGVMPQEEFEPLTVTPSEVIPAPEPPVFESPVPAFDASSVGDGVKEAVPDTSEQHLSEEPAEPVSEGSRITMVPPPTEVYDVSGYAAPEPVEEGATERFNPPETLLAAKPRPGFTFRSNPGSDLGNLGQLPTAEAPEDIPPRGTSEEFDVPVPVEDAAPASNNNFKEELSVPSTPAYEEQQTPLEAPAGPEVSAAPENDFPVPEESPAAAVSPFPAPPMGVPEEAAPLVPEIVEAAPAEPASDNPDESTQLLQNIRDSFKLFNSLAKQHTVEVILSTNGLTPQGFCETIVQEFPEFSEQYNNSLTAAAPGNYQPAVLDLVQCLQLEAESAVFAGDLERAEKCITPVYKLIYS